jgi:TusA-related sulfurtransferase
MKELLKCKHQLDLRGLECASPVVKLNKSFKQFADGEIIEVISNDPTAPLTVPVWAETSGNQIVETVKTDSETRFYISKGKR